MVKVVKKVSEDYVNHAEILKGLIEEKLESEKVGELEGKKVIKAA